MGSAKRVVGVASAVCLVLGFIGTSHAQVLDGDLQFTSILPCRIIDTRGVGQRFTTGQTQTFNVYGTNLSSQGGNPSGCSVPGFTTDGVAQVAALAINFVAVNPSGAGHLTVWPTDREMPGTSALNFQALNPNLNIANEQPTSVRQDIAGNDFSINASQTLDVVADVVGYYSRSARQTQINATSPNLIGGFSGNSVTPAAVGVGVFGATIGGGGQSGFPNSVSGDFGTVGGGVFNTVIGGSVGRATIGGGSFNTASGGVATVGGGASNTASGGGATVGGGESNIASGAAATVPGGQSNEAKGFYSFAAGQRAIANYFGSFVWADASTFDFSDSAANQFSVRAVGGVQFFTSSNLSTGCSLAAAGTSWSCTSDRSAKENLSPVDGLEVLRKVASLQIQRWNAKRDPAAIPHMGPMAQDFHAAFQVGDDDKHIAMVDADGVALAAIQGLYRMLRKQERDLERKEAEVRELKAQVGRLESLEGRLSALEQHVEAKLHAKVLPR